MLSNIQIHLFCEFGGVREYRLAEKRLEPRKKRNPWFCPFSPPARKYFNFGDDLYQHSPTFFLGKIFTNIFYAESFFPTCLVWVLWLFEWTHLVFLDYAKNGFSPKTTSQWRHRCAPPTSTNEVLSPGFNDAFTDSLS